MSLWFSSLFFDLLPQLVDAGSSCSGRSWRCCIRVFISTHGVDGVPLPYTCMHASFWRQQAIYTVRTGYTECFLAYHGWSVFLLISPFLTRFPWLFFLPTSLSNIGIYSRYPYPFLSYSFFFSFILHYRLWAGQLFRILLTGKSLELFPS